MTGFHYGDQPIHLRGQEYRLRLTLGALAEISQALSVAGPKDLGRVMKTITAEQMCRVLQALIRPVHGHNIPDIKRPDLTPDIITKIAQLFEVSFAHQG